MKELEHERTTNLIEIFFSTKQCSAGEQQVT